MNVLEKYLIEKVMFNDRGQIFTKNEIKELK